MNGLRLGFVLMLAACVPATQGSLDWFAQASDAERMENYRGVCRGALSYPGHQPDEAQLDDCARDMIAIAEERLAAQR